MKKSTIKRYMKRTGVDLDQRISRTGGDQYLSNFLHEFAQDVKSQVLADIIGYAKKLRRDDQ